MEVVTSLTATLIIAVCIALVILGFWLDVKRRSMRHHERQRLLALEKAHAAVDMPVPPPLMPGVAPGHSTEGFLCQHAPSEADLHVYGKQALFGPATRPVTVHNGGQLMMFGPCASSITVRRGGMAIVYGLVTGDLVNEGGEMHIYGAVIGAIRRNGGMTHVHPLARISPEALGQVRT